MLKHLLGAAAALALLAATPAGACGDCKSCPHKMGAAAQVQQPGTAAEAGKKDGAACRCMQAGEKTCKCGDRCACASCPVHGQKDVKAEKKG